MSLRCRLQLMRRHAERGFTTVTLMGVLSVGGLLVAAGFAAVDPDISLSREDQDYKQAYGAAEAGLQWYLNRLGQDNSFYVRCDNVPDPNATEDAPVNQPWDETGSDDRLYRNLPGEEARYTVELLPAPGYPDCVEGNQYSMVDTGGNLRLRVTGRSRDEYRTVRATLRRKQLHRLHLLHPLRDARPRRLPGRCERDHGHQPVLDASAPRARASAPRSSSRPPT